LRVRIGAISRKKSYKNIEKSHITLLLSFYQNTVFSPQISLELLIHLALPVGCFRPESSIHRAGRAGVHGAQRAAAPGFGFGA
jgi:hypothetical protein